MQWFVQLALILEAKYGDLGQMFNPDREAHIIEQARLYLSSPTEREAASATWSARNGAPLV